ncbi:hypothetical protein [Mucisphaera sp.]|uniref:hypothetical protein n=1 Tax=Mucisphaera sp. TaxID=2913024 RepID=UPI003D1111A3
MPSKPVAALLLGFVTAGLLGCAQDPAPVEALSRPLASNATETGEVFANRLDDGPSAEANPGPSWTVLTLEQRQRRSVVFDPQTGFLATRYTTEQTAREDPWLAAPITIPDTQSRQYRQDRWRHGGHEGDPSAD